MPSDYRTGRAGLRPMQGRTAFIAPDKEPDYAVKPSVASGPMSAEERAGWHIMGVPSTAAAALRRAGVHPFDVEKWTDAGVAFDGYKDMETLARGGMTPEVYATYPKGLGPDLVLQMRDAQIDGPLAATWQALLRRLKAQGRVGEIIGLHKGGVTPQQFQALSEAMSSTSPIGQARCPSRIEALELLRVGDMDVVVAMLRQKVPTGSIKRLWERAVEQAGVTLGKALVLVGADLSLAGAWRATGLSDDRCARLASAGYGPDEATSEAVAAMTDADLDVLIALSGHAAPGSMALVGP